jgi:serine/threonine protein kinase
MAAVLDGLNAFEAHPRVVGLLDRLVVLLTGELRNRAILLLERKRLGLELDRVAALFREIHSPYKIQKVLGQGLFTESYLARDEGTGLEVVVRVLRQEFANQPHVRAGFLDLSNRSVHLVHEKLALTREARSFPDQQIYFAVRDYIPGVTLQRVLEAGKRFKPVQVVRILWEVAQALTPLHRRAICHGGIKPSNIFLCEEERVILGDPSLPVGGIGVALDRLAYDYRYVAPEMFRGRAEPAEPRSDFYALGCVAYELLCGAPPFVSDNFLELAARHLNDRIIPPSQRESKLTAWQEERIMKLLARSPGERYGTLKEVLEAFEPWVEWAASARVNSRRGRKNRPPPPRLPLLRDASLANYQGGQSVLGFDQTQTGAFLSEGTNAGTNRPAVAGETDTMDSGHSLKIGPVASQEGLPQVPGYDILGFIGRGGMGTVYRAEQKSLKRPVVLKTISLGEQAGNPEFLERFGRETLLMAHLKHPNIVNIIDVLQIEGHAILVMELVEGGTLEGKALAGPLPMLEVAEIVATLARAVHYMHEQGILHRDLKPANILLTSEGQPKITDFGLAKSLGTDIDTTVEGVIFGTPTYMAPEQARGEKNRIGPASEVYSLGGILYFLLTGRPPFRGHNVEVVLHQVREESPVPPREINPQTPKELESVCLKCLEKDPTRRYPTAAALADDLDRWLRGEPITASPLSLWRRLASFFTFRQPAKPQGGGRTPDA